MGAVHATQMAPPNAKESEGKYVANWKTGYRYATNSIRSINYPEATKKPGPLGSEIWGPYKKKYVKSMFGQMLFQAPEKVDDVPILCRCREIYSYVRATNGSRYMGALGAIAVGSKRPACWDDAQTIWDPAGGDTFTVTVGHPQFYEYMVSESGTIGIVTNVAKSLIGGKLRKIKPRVTRKRLHKKNPRHTRHSKQPL
jgi:hypothetical protein